MRNTMNVGIGIGVGAIALGIGVVIFGEVFPELLKSLSKVLAYDSNGSASGGKTINDFIAASPLIKILPTGLAIAVFTAVAGASIVGYKKMKG